jgi:uncharacterized integral membrane protein
MSDGDPMSDSLMEDPVYEGVYGPFRIEAQDRREVLGYRLALTAVAVGQLGLLVQLRSLGPSGLWPWLIVMALGLGLALRWIHIYLKPLHQALQLFWLVGCLGWLALAWQAGPDTMLPAMADQRLWVVAIGPFFAALAGIGFKEFFCFRRAEAIGITLLLPIALLGYWLGLLSPLLCLQILGFETALMLVLCLRKFPMPAAADVGDKSVFAHLKAQQEAIH